MANIVPRENLMGDPINANFKNFLWKVHQELDYTVPSPIQYDMCDYLQANVDSEFTPGRDGDRELLMGFRGVAKTHITTSFAIWRLRRERKHRVLVTSSTGRYANLIATFAFQMVNGFDWLASLKPGPAQRQSSIAFDVPGVRAQQHESFASVPITGQITGRRCTIGIADDLETPNTSDTEGARADLLKRASELVGAIVVPGGDIYMLGTAQTEDTFYLKMEERGFHIRIYPILFPHLPDTLASKEDPRIFTTRYGARLAPFILNRVEANPALAGTSTNVERFDERDIQKRKKAWGNTEFERQFLMLLDAGKGRGNPLKLKDIPVMELKLPPQGLELKLPGEMDFMPLPAHRWDGIDVDAMTGDSHLYAPSRTDIYLVPEERACFVDPSGEGKDETTWTIGAGLLGRVFGLYQGASTEGHTSTVMAQIAKDCKRWGVQVIEVESNFGQGMFGELLRPACTALGYEPDIVEVRQGKAQKEKRIVETLEPLLTANRLVLSADLLRRDFPVDYEHLEEEERRYHRLTYQLTRMTKARGAIKHDDRVDGLAGLCHHFIGVLLREVAKKNEDARVKAIEAEVEKLIDERKKAGLPVLGAEGGRSPLGRPSRRYRR